MREHLAKGTALYPPSLATLEHGDIGEEGWEGEGLGKGIHWTSQNPNVTSLPARSRSCAHTCTPAHPTGSPRVFSHRTPSKQSTSFFFLSFFFVHSFTSVPTFFHSHFISTNHIYFPILFNKSSEVNAFVVSFTVLIISVFLSGDPQHRIPSCFSCVIDSNFIQKTFWLY